MFYELMNALKVRAKEKHRLQDTFMHFSFLTYLAKNAGSVKNPEFVERTDLIPGKENEFSLVLGEFNNQVVVANLRLVKRTKVEFQERSRV